MHTCILSQEDMRMLLTQKEGSEMWFKERATTQIASAYTQPIGYVVLFTQPVPNEKQLFQTQGVWYIGEGVESFWVFLPRQVQKVSKHDLMK